MFSRESEFFTRVKRAVQEKYPDAFLSTEFVNQPKTFPMVFFTEEMSTHENDRYYGTSEPLFMRVVYQAQVFTTGSRRKTQAAQIMAIIRDVMFRYGFRERDNRLLPNLDDGSIARRVARWEAVIDTENVYGGID